MSDEAPTAEVATPPQEPETPPTPPRAPNAKGIWLRNAKNIRVEAHVYTDEEGQIATITNEPIAEQIARDAGMDHAEVVAEFSLPKRTQVARYRRMASRWYNEAQSLVIDRNVIKTLLIRYHIRTLELPPSSGEKLVLIWEGKEDTLHLSEETEQKLDQLHPSIMEVLVNKFVANGDLIF
jgi:hypothetical protein